MALNRKVLKKYADPQEPIPVGEVQESDWAEWEDSVAFQDSLMGGFVEPPKPAPPPEPQATPDIFANVKKHDA